MTKKPGTMTDAAWARLQRLTPTQRDAVLERAAIIAEACKMTMEEADEEAWRQEGTR